jgi:hypothetical protein
MESSIIIINSYIINVIIINADYNYNCKINAQYNNYIIFLI